MTPLETIASLLVEIYGEQKGRVALKRVSKIVKDFPNKQDRPQKIFSQKDVVLITYADTLLDPDRSALAVLKQFADNYLKEAVSVIHLLPFFPFSSDDGFSVLDFMHVDPPLGNWNDIAVLKSNFDLMFDWVLNHVSAQSPWFQNYLSSKEGFEQLAIEVDPKTDLSQVTRPRALPLLTAFKKKDGQTVHLWTTFSADQIDLNYRSIDVLVKMIEVLLFYVQKGAVILRLDAVSYLWKEVGTNCIHHLKTHALVRLFRAMLDQVAPHVAIITETNVPHQENISYFGDRGNEAQMVYNFSLPPLLLHTFLTEDSRILSGWVSDLQTGSTMTTFFNFTASHDGVGVRPLEGILTEQQITALIEQVSQNGGRVSYRNNADGTRSPYELNITYLDALRQKSDTDQQHIQRFLASQALALMLPGVPGVYIHSLLGSRNWHNGVLKTGQPRSINRRKLPQEEVVTELKDPNSFRAKIFFPYLNLLRLRRKQSAFHPNSAQKVLDLGPKVFCLVRHDDRQKIYALTNVSSELLEVSIPGENSARKLRDLITQEEYTLFRIRLLPHQTLWLNDT